MSEHSYKGQDSEKILLTGATGYVGGRLLSRLINDGREVRCLVRRPGSLSQDIHKRAEVVKGDLLDANSLKGVFKDISTAYYLVHSMGMGGDFEKKDRVAAENFVASAEKAGVKRIVYLGGLGRGEDLSTHLASRQEVGRVLRDSKIPVIEFRAAVIVGSGSLSFEMIKALVNKLPVMTTPKWVSTMTQPIYIGDVIEYLVASLSVDIQESVVVEIGGADRVSYLGMMEEYAMQTDKKRLMIKVPVLTPRLSSWWLWLVTPLQADVGRELIEGVRNETVVADDTAERLFDIRPLGINEAIKAALSENI